MVCAFAIMAASGVAYYLLCVAENRHRDAKYGKPHDDVQTGLEVERADVTDMQNSNFRFTY